MSNEDIILKIENATKRFAGLTANDNISFDVKKNSIVGVVGPNGAGKTTLFNSISGAHTLTSGRIIFQGKDITKLKANQICRLGIGRTFQVPQSLDNLTVLENATVAALSRHSDILAAQKYAKRSIEFCGLKNESDAMAGSLNVIRKKRLEIARALATEPVLLLLDETMAGLTNTERLEAVELIRDINKEGITILTIEHVMDVVMTVSEKVVVISSGKLLTEGTPDEVSNNSKVIEAYLGGKSHA